LWTDKGKEFHNKYGDEILKHYSVKLYLTENEEKLNKKCGKIFRKKLQFLFRHFT